MKKLLLTVLLITLALAYKPQHIGSKWQSKSAEEKIEILDKEVCENPNHQDFFTIGAGKIFIQDNNLSFNVAADDMPSQGILNRQKREKVIHSAGMIAKMTFESFNNHTYTGVFKGGSGFVRYSCAGPPSQGSVIPAIAVKFLRDGVESGNLFALYSLSGQESSNVFEHDTSTFIPMFAKDASIGVKTLFKKFSQVSDWPNKLGHSNCAQYDKDGNKEENINFPFRVIFHPTLDAHNYMASDLDITTYYFVDEMEGMKVDYLFDVYVQPTPDSMETELIGRIRMDSEFKSSQYGDATMFFQHQKFEDDLAIKPEWATGARKIIDYQMSQETQYHWPDIGY